ncbi:ornithine cyclodeaminase [Tistlia consotensis]|uniref:Ornithine cyclodeaminase n=1 Tax=Tistlia consotensis USBA 355 TaxID=560819 RepID=A0A1Y6B509_9PROT|nr:ornithine cyclodeaminase family protein [Tistlia consotensis]SME92495.1 ornithine cyclodeaminase [Tistlia consotensis USBA 355]SNR28057.1 ornithine cyclodeaminase [Tistlia consotensis]
MRIVAANEVQAALDFPLLVDRLRDAFRRDVAAPVRHHHNLPRGGEPDATLLLMPAWQSGRHVGIKIVTVTPGNAERGLPAVTGVYLLNDWKTGAPIALIDGPMLTLRRTAAASALAASYLARQDAERLLMVGTGALAAHLVQAHAAVRPICNVLIWGRNPARAEKLARALNRRDFKVDFTEDLEGAARGAHVISCATLSHDPLVQGEWLQPGTHLDLVGGFTPEMRETDDEAIHRARVFVDTRAGATTEAGDIVQPLASGVLKEADIAGDLFELCRGERPARRSYAEITLFKSVGTALEDLAAAQLVVERT